MKEDASETELLVMVTPDLVAPLDAEQVPHEYPGSTTTSPTDKELIGFGMMEVPTYGPECPDCPVPGGNSYPGAGALTPIPEPRPLPLDQSYDSAPNTGTESVPPPPEPPVGTPQAQRGPSRLSTRPSYLTNRTTQVSSNRVQQASVSNTAQIDSNIQQSGYSMPQAPATTRPRTAPVKRTTRPGMIAP